eukprot:2212040-Amphidinium_carterae.1
MHGTQDAAHIWQRDYSEVLAAGGFIRGRHNAATFFHEFHEELEVRLMVHGDDFVILAGSSGLGHVDKLLRGRYTCKDMGTIGPDLDDEVELLVLNRKVRVGIDGDRKFVEMIADPRHAQILLEEAGLKDARSKGISTPREKLADAAVLAGQATPLLNAEGKMAYRSSVMRIAYVSHDRADLAESAKTLAQHMQAPRVFHASL